MGQKAANLNIAKHGIVVLVFTISGQLLGFVREAVLGKYFGTTYAFDAFTLTFSVILFVNSFLRVVPFFAIPTLARIHSQENYTEFSGQLALIAVLVFCIVAVVVTAGEIWAERIVMYAASGFRTDSEVFNLSVLLLRVSIPVLFLLTLSQLLRSVLNLRKVFAVPALESLFFNAGIIMAILIAWNWLDIESPVSLSFGYYIAYSLFGSLCFFVFLRSTKKPLFGRLYFRRLIKIMSGISLLLCATGLNSLNPLVLMWQASYLPEGAISGLGYVHRLLSFSIMNIVNSFLIVFLPVSAVAFARNDIEQLKAGTEKLLLNFFTISVFLSAFIILNNETVVRLIYERGMFGEDSARLVSGLLYCYLPWILFFPLSNVAVRIFYVYKDYKNLTFVSAGGLLLTLTLAPFLRGWIGVNGLGLMASGHMMCYCLALLFLVHKRYFKIDFPAILKNSLVNAGLAGAIISIMLFLKSCALSDPYTLLGTSLFFLIPVALWRLNRSLDLASILKNRL